MHHFVLVYHIKSQYNTFTFVVKISQNVEKFKGGKYFCKALYIQDWYSFIKNLIKNLIVCVFFYISRLAGAPITESKQNPLSKVATLLFWHLSGGTTS